MVRDGEVAWLHKRDMPRSGPAQHAEDSNHQSWQGQKQGLSGAAPGNSRKRKEPPAGRQTQSTGKASVTGQPYPASCTHLALVSANVTFIGSLFLAPGQGHYAISTRVLAASSAGMASSPACEHALRCIALHCIAFVGFQRFAVQYYFTHM